MRTSSGLLLVLFVSVSSAFSPVRPQLSRSSLGVSFGLDPSSESKSNEANTDVAWDWKTLSDDVFAEDKRPIILFDGHCNLCNGGVNFALDYDSEAQFRFVSLRSKVGQSLLLRAGRNPRDLSSIGLVHSDGAQSFFQTDAVLRIAQKLDSPFLKLMGTFGFLVPPFFRDVIYKVVSENRYAFGEQYDQCRIDFDGEFDTRFVQDPEEIEEEL